MYTCFKVNINMNENNCMFLITAKRKKLEKTFGIQNGTEEYENNK